MTVSGTASRERYDGNGVTVNFPITFVYGEDIDINVTHIDVLGVETSWVLDGVGDTGFTIVSGAVVANTAPADETELVIYRTTPLTQAVRYVENRATPAIVTEDTIDKLTMITQELDDASDRAMTLPVTAEEAVSAVLPLPVLLNLIRWNAAGDAIENVTAEAIAGQMFASNFVVDKYVDGVDFTAGVTTQLVLTSVPGSENNTQIYFGGVYQEKSTYTLSGTTITFDAAIPGGVSGVEVVFLTGEAPSVPQDGSVTTPKLTAGAVTNPKLGAAAVTTSKLGGIDTIAEETPDAGVHIDGFGIKDNAPAPTSWPSFSAYLNATQSNITGNDQIDFDTEEDDTNGDFDIATGRFTPTVPGRYLLIFKLFWTAIVAGDRLVMQIQENGSDTGGSIEKPANGTQEGIIITHIFNANGTGDYYECFANNVDRDTSDAAGGDTASYFQGSRIA